jgi:general secretion pathway protein B
MSYILDALRKAEAERERGSVPGIHAQPAFGGGQPGGASAKSRAWIVVLVLGVLLVLVVALAVYLWLGRRPANEVVPVAVQSAPAAVAPVAAALPTPASVAPPTPTAPPATRKARPAPAATTSASAPASTPSRTDERIYATKELPEDIRRQLPALSVGGSMYSPTPADRLVIINGQVLHEGDRVAPDLVLQQIRLKAAVLAFKGYRYTLAF